MSLNTTPIYGNFKTCAERDATVHSELRSDFLGAWLPLALADLVSAWTGETRANLLRSWGLPAMADDMDKNAIADFLDKF